MSEHLKEINRHAKMTLYGSISILGWISRIFGVFPFHKTIKCVNLFTLCNLLLFTTSLITALQETSTLRQIAAGTYYNTNLVSNFGLIFHFTSGCVVLYTIYICNFFKNSDVKKVLQTLNEIDEAFKRMGQKFQYRRNKIFTTCVCIFSMIIVLLIIIVQGLNLRREKLKPINVNTLFGYVFPLIVANVMTTQFSFTVLAIFERLKKINHQLKNVDKMEDKCLNATENKIVILMKLYDSLCDIANQTNNNYMIQLFVALTNQIGIILFSIFHFYWTVKK